MIHSLDIERIMEIVDRAVSRGADLTEPYDHYIMLGFAFASLGEEGRSPFHRICAVSPKYKREEVDEKFDNCLRTGRGNVGIGTFIQYAKDAGIDITRPRGRKKKSEQQKSKDRAEKLHDAKAHLHAKMDFRYNVRLHRLEYREKPSGTFKPLDDRMVDTFYISLIENGINLTKTDFLTLLDSEQFAPKIDVIREWLEGLPKWDPSQPDYLAEFWGHLRPKDPEKWEFHLKFLKKWHVGWVGMMMEEVDKHDLMVVIIGPQGIGKTYFCMHLLPPFLAKDYTFAPSPSAPIDKDFTFSLTEKPLTFLDEIDMKSHSKANAYKYVTSMRSTTLRDSYGHMRQDCTKRSALIATCNDEEYLVRQEGNRRFLSLPIVDTLNLYTHPLPYEGAFAQALYLLHSEDYSPYMTRDDNEEITRQNEAHTIADPLHEAVSCCFRLPREGEVGEVFTTADIIKALELALYRNIKANPSQIGKALKEMGCQPINSKTGRKYHLMPIEAPERDELRRKEARKEMMTDKL